MPNDYFQFKQFTVYQDRCAMKVCTDACLFGAIAAFLFAENIAKKTVLDIGTGTGLLSLMFVQKNSNTSIYAIEIDEAASQQAAENFAASPWSEQLKVHHTSIQDFTTTQLINQSTGQLFNFIFSNPPFFENDLKSPDAKRNVALHEAGLSLEELLAAINRLLAHDGAFGILLPYHRTAYFESLALSNGFHLSHKILVKQTPKHNYFRSILFFERGEAEVAEKEIIIKDATNAYTPAFVELLKDYYLYL